MNLTSGMTWQWVLTGPITPLVPAQVYITDAFDTDTATVTAIAAQGSLPFCYMSAGTWEDWRPDAANFPDKLKGNPMSGWAGERYLDIREWRALAYLIAARLDMAKAKGFVGVEFDNVDTYTHGKAKTGFNLTSTNQLNYNKLLAALAWQRGMVPLLKNDLTQMATLEPFFGGAVTERAFEYAEENYTVPFTAAKKPIFACEYQPLKDGWCAKARVRGISLMQKPADGIVTNWRKVCP